MKLTKYQEEFLRGMKGGDRVVGLGRYPTGRAILHAGLANRRGYLTRLGMLIRAGLLQEVTNEMENGRGLCRQPAREAPTACNQAALYNKWVYRAGLGYVPRDTDVQPRPDSAQTCEHPAGVSVEPDRSRPFFANTEDLDRR